MDQNFKDLDIYKSFIKASLPSTKSNLHLLVYHEVLQKYRNKKITFVEIGIKAGGSLLMWRDWLGKDARIIGIDLDPNAKKMEKYGFEIFIGDQASPNFWKNFFEQIGNVDVILDDGGHTNETQILTTYNTVKFLNNGGILLIEDTSSSYLKKFYNPQKFSFINYCKFLIDDIHVRSLDSDSKKNLKKKSSLSDKIYSIKFFSDLVAFEIDRSKCFNTEYFWNKDTKEKNFDEIIDFDNYRNPRWSTKSYQGFIDEFIYILSKKFSFLKSFTFFKLLKNKIINLKGLYYQKKISKKLKNFFK